ncbi:MAG TPA: CdaR family protein [Pyrinomonadaceae bacterium]|nr:CdaR family protein [Pyrinomonadaceae bacterium]
MAFEFTKKRRGGGADGGVARRWLREFFLEDWTLKLMAFLITLGLWYAVTAQRTPSTVRLRNVPLEFLLPENVEISNDPVEEVDVTLEGSQGKLAEINARNLVARADVTGLKPGDRVARLTDRNVTMDVPEGVRLLDITPRSVTLRLEPVVEREVTVEARFEGQPPDGFVLRGVQVVPDRVRVRGPESHVQAIEKAYTETISLEGRRESLQLPQTAVDIPDRKVVPLDATVNVRVEMAEEQSERRIANVQVRAASGAQVSPQTVSVTLRGPRAIVESLRPEDVRVVVETGDDGSPVPRLSLPPAATGRVQLLSTTPSELTVNR